MIDRSLNYGRNHIRRFLEQSMPYDRVLDVGAGHGDDLMLARAVNPKARLFAVEAHRPFVQNLVDNGIAVSVLDLERDRLPFDDGGCDVVIANQVLEHTKDIFWIFHEVSRVLRVGGKIIIGVPNLASLHNRILLLLGKQPSPIKSCSAHVRGFSRGDICMFLEKCFRGGYELEKFGGANFYPFPPMLARPLARLVPSMAWGIFLLLEKSRDYEGSFLEFPVKEKLETKFFLG